MKDFVYVYILVSHANQAIHYTGITRDLEQRLLEHNRPIVHTPRNTGHGELKLPLYSNREQSAHVRKIFKERIWSRVRSASSLIFALGRSEKATVPTRHPWGRPMQAVRNELFSTMKAFFSIILALAIAIGSVEAGPVRTARNVAKDSAHTAKNVAHSVVKGTRRAVHTVVDTFTP